MALHGIGVGLFAGDGEQLSQDLGGLAHVQAGDDVGQAALQADHRLEEGQAHLQQGHDLLLRGLGPVQPGEPFHRRAWPQQGRLAEGLGSTGQHQIGVAPLNGVAAHIDGLHARAAVALHGPGGGGLVQAQTQLGHTGRVHLVGRGVHAAQHHLLEGVLAEGLTQQQGATGIDRQIDGAERTGPAARLDEGRAGAVD